MTVRHSGRAVREPRADYFFFASFFSSFFAGVADVAGAGVLLASSFVNPLPTCPGCVPSALRWLPTPGRSLFDESLLVVSDLAGCDELVPLVVDVAPPDEGVVLDGVVDVDGVEVPDVPIASLVCPVFSVGAELVEVVFDGVLGSFAPPPPVTLPCASQPAFANAAAPITARRPKSF